MIEQQTLVILIIPGIKQFHQVFGFEKNIVGDTILTLELLKETPISIVHPARNMPNAVERKTSMKYMSRWLHALRIMLIF